MNAGCLANAMVGRPGGPREPHNRFRPFARLRTKQFYPLDGETQRPRSTQCLYRRNSRSSEGRAILPEDILGAERAETRLTLDRRVTLAQGFICGNCGSVIAPATNWHGRRNSLRPCSILSASSGSILDMSHSPVSAMNYPLACFSSRTPRMIYHCWAIVRILFHVQ